MIQDDLTQARAAIERLRLTIQDLNLPAYVEQDMDFLRLVVDRADDEIENLNGTILRFRNLN